MTTFERHHAPVSLWHVFAAVIPLSVVVHLLCSLHGSAFSAFDTLGSAAVVFALFALCELDQRRRGPTHLQIGPHDLIVGGRAIDPNSVRAVEREPYAPDTVRLIVVSAVAGRVAFLLDARDGEAAQEALLQVCTGAKRVLRHLDRWDRIRLAAAKIVVVAMLGTVALAALTVALR